METYEQDFLIAVYRIPIGNTVRDLIANGELHESRCFYLLRRWKRRGWYAHVGALDLGWLTDKGKEMAKNHVELAESPEIALDTLLMRLEQKTRQWAFVDSITTRVDPPECDDRQPTVFVRLDIKGGGQVRHVFTTDQIRAIGIDMSIKFLKNRVHNEIFGIGPMAKVKKRA